MVKKTFKRRYKRVTKKPKGNAKMVTKASTAGVKPYRPPKLQGIPSTMIPKNTGLGTFSTLKYVSSTLPTDTTTGSVFNIDLLSRTIWTQDAFNPVNALQDTSAYIEYVEYNLVLENATKTYSSADDLNNIQYRFFLFECDRDDYNDIKTALELLTPNDNIQKELIDENDYQMTMISDYRDSYHSSTWFNTTGSLVEGSGAITTTLVSVPGSKIINLRIPINKVYNFAKNDGSTTGNSKKDTLGCVYVTDAHNKTAKQLNFTSDSRVYIFFKELNKKR